MKFIWAGDREERNQERIFCLKAKITNGILRLCAVDFFRVFINGELCSYGPDRTAAGYSRVREISLKNTEELKIYVLCYNTPNFSCAFQKPFFGAEIIANGKIIV